MLRICPDALDCPPDQPLDNFSSEADDTLDFISTVYFGTPPPPLFQNWSATSCGITYVSTISQIDADQQAAAAAILCAINGHNPNPNTNLFVNSPQTCCVPCPDGTSTCYTLPGGLIVAANQATADSLAHQIACSLVSLNRVCIGQLPRCLCVGTDYAATLTSTQPVQWSISGGSLPPGLLFSDGFGFTTTIAGNPSVSGQYTFKVKGQTLEGPFTEKTFTLTVLEITTTVLPAFSIGVPYSYQLQAAGGSGNYNWKMTSGSLPPGLTMSLTGLISGTPT